MGIFAISTLVVTGIGVYILGQVAPNFQPGNKKVLRDLEFLRAKLAKLYPQPVDLPQKEWEQLAALPSEMKFDGGLVKEAFGLFTTLFHEPAFRFGFRKYMQNGSGVLLFQIGEEEVYYWFKKGRAQVVWNGTLIGEWEDNILYGSDKKGVIGRINTVDDHLEVQLGEETAAALNRPQVIYAKKNTFQERLFMFTAKGISSEHFRLVFALVLPYLTVRNLKKGFELKTSSK